MCCNGWCSTFHTYTMRRYQSRHITEFSEEVTRVNRSLQFSNMYKRTIILRRIWIEDEDGIMCDIEHRPMIETPWTCLGISLLPNYVLRMINNHMGCSSGQKRVQLIVSLSVCQSICRLLPILFFFVQFCHRVTLSTDAAM